MKCQQCGTELTANDQFCHHCGARQVPQEQPVAVEQPTQTPVWETAAPAAPVYTNAPVQNPPPAYDYAAPTGQQPPADAEPHHGYVSFFDAVKYSIVRIVDFTHRASKSEFWWGYLFLQSVSIILGFIPYVGAALAAGVSLPIISMTIRRFHDVGVEWQQIFKMLIPVYGIIFFIKTCLLPSVGDNEFGYGPR